MGVDIGNARWSYTGFGEFRARLAAAENINLNRMEGYCRRYCDHSDGSECDATTPWDGVDSPLVPLLNHSDCDGELSAEECARVWPRLNAILATFPIDDYDYANGMALVYEMQAHERCGTPLEFR